MSASLTHMTTARFVTKNGVDEVKAKLEAGELDPREAVKQAEAEITQRTIYKPPSKEEKLARYRRDKERKVAALSRSVHFIDPHFSTKFKLVQGLYLIGAVSGQGKSTTLRNLLAGYVLQGRKRKARVLTNEESSLTVYDGVSCVLLGKDFSAHQRMKNTPSEREEIEEKSLELMDYIDVEAGDGAYDMSCMEDVERILRYTEEKDDAGLVAIDYWQTITHSRENPEMETYRVLKEIGNFLKEYGQRASCPVVNFVQLQDKSDSKDFKSRVENDKTIFNHSFGAIEIIPNFETKTSKFVIVKDRLGGATGEVVEMHWVNGRFEMGGESI